MVLKSECLKYDIVYHWGFIWKQAASATLSLNHKEDEYTALLAARSMPWADKIFRIRDTLKCVMKTNALIPQIYYKISHEGKDYGRDIVRYQYSGNNVTAFCMSSKPLEYKYNHITLTAKAPAYDMLSIFYMLRSLNFSNMSGNKVYTSNVFSGRSCEQVAIRLISTEEITLRDKSKHKAYHISFTFSQHGRTKTSEDIHAWISADSRRIPLILEGKLPVGEVKCYYAGSK